MTQPDIQTFTKQYLDEIAKNIESHRNRSIFAGWVSEDAAREWQQALEQWEQKAAETLAPQEAPQPKPIVWTTSKGPYYRCEDAETKQHLFSIGQDKATRGWNVYYPDRVSAHTTFSGVKHEAQTFLRNRGYQAFANLVVQ